MADTEQSVENEEAKKITEEKAKEILENVSLNAHEDKENKEEKNNKIKTEDQNVESKEKQKTETQQETPGFQTTKAHHKTFTKTTLPHILTEYGLEDKDHPARKKKERKKKKKKKGEQFYDEEEDLRQQKKAREEKFRQSYGDNRTINKHYAEYLDFIEKKVINQRLKLQKEREEEEKRKKEREEEERRRHKLQRRRESVPLTHDDKYLQDLPKTDMFRIIELQDRLKKQGKLKSQSDVDKFWREITQPDVFYDQFKVKMSGEPIKQPPKTEDLSQIPEKSGTSLPPADLPPRSLSHISESESTRSEQPWAITQQYQSTQGARTLSREKPKKVQIKDPALDLEKRCPKLEMPPLACFSLKLGEKPPDPEEIKRKVELKAREKNRKRFVRKLRKMHQLAMANAAAANRILAQRGDLTQILEGATLRDLRNYCCEPIFDEDLAVYDEPESAVRYPAEMTRAIEIYPEEESQSSSASHSRPSSYKSSTSSHRLSPLDSDSSSREGTEKSRRKKKLSLDMIEYPTPLPLTYSEVAGSAKIMEAKCMSTNWTNYMQAGKSVFAPT